MKETKKSLRRSRGGHKTAQTKLKKKLMSARQPRYPRLAPPALDKMLRHWVSNGLIPWTQDLFELLKADAQVHNITIDGSSGEPSA